MTWPELVAQHLDAHDPTWHAVEAQIPELLDEYRSRWAETYGYPCALAVSPIQYMKLAQHLRILSAVQITKGLEGYFATEDAYVNKQRHPLNLWLAAPMQYVAKPATQTRECPHEIACQSRTACVTLILEEGRRARPA